jgi:AcrR family transcriptional regulator
MDGSVASRRIGPPRQGIAERIWEAARIEFSKRGYHGARVQGIARGAACNVALMYRHWASKRALYLDILRAVWLTSANEIARLLEEGAVRPDAIVAAYVDAMMMDPMGAQILIREYLDGAPFLGQLSANDPSVLEPVRRAAATLPAARRDGGSEQDPILAMVTLGGLAALVASTREAVRPFSVEPPDPETWRNHVLHLLVNGLGPGPGAPAPGPNGANGSSAPHPDVP